MTFREKHLWVAIIAGLLVWGAYAWRFGERVLGGGLKQADFAADMGGLFVLGLIAVVVLESGLTALAMLTTSKAERRARDEREGLATLQASHVLAPAADASALRANPGLKEAASGPGWVLMRVVTAQ